jgi:hypothetical protein
MTTNTARPRLFVEDAGSDIEGLNIYAEFEGVRYPVAHVEVTSDHEVTTNAVTEWGTLDDWEDTAEAVGFTKAETVSLLARTPEDDAAIERAARVIVTSLDDSGRPSWANHTTEDMRRVLLDALAELEVTA